MAATLTEKLLDPILRTDPAGPRVTFYDDATGERIEVSAVTLANWAAKTANLLRDEIGLQPGAKVSVLLPAHWQTAAVLLGAWWAGAEVVLTADPDAEVALVHGNRVDDAGDIPEILALSLDAFGKPVADLPVGVTDYATSVRVHGDQFRPSGDGPALAGRPVDEVLAAARARAETHSLAVGDRVLSSLSWGTPDELIDGLLSVLVAGASLVQVSNPDSSKLERRTATEKVTKTLG
ncbi:TIGR03089 family protein [Rhodococcus sp. BP-252]|uniref:TIGR03089 family protein n=1 Tax=unclassified Rhodococcus (in: high G+C Gram-positive bacteria) TaxID=192944 RepID=UPI001C9AC974|nr:MULTISPECIES: TIGR03089 family protein [unclassified Rhodococcus (in: high G+C Gram-positive bacteria)]MBY6412475.1 TIGR03089 family protein [Rhodococcus sp. BP-320]MBY6417055.1 TIGR03089 family protein [Rhodococcus sp. BP-321]MBY6421982.1 TIGR03089 family protein [Rhodococcus sp. BP-324]MBY6427079.1 TIGR03089 family protein [Rhodococcus sp. BP-323]MBY6432408.1 TIGR03089 family protein [Rhodococcus sp. BP-322]